MSPYYYHAQGESAENLTLMRLLDQQYTDMPYYGVRRMAAWLRSQGDAVHHTRVARLLRTMGLETLYPKPPMSEPPPAHRVYPYLLRGVPITRVNQVWSTDITYIRLHGGFIYLVAVMAWFRRYVLAWAVSITMDVGLCLAALDHALEVARPEIFNSDQGAQLHPSRLYRTAGISGSPDQYGRARTGTRQLSLARLNHWLPGGEAHPEIVEGTAECQHQLTDAFFPQADAVFDDATTLDTAIAMLDPPSTLVQRQTVSKPSADRLLQGAPLP
jgi:hypothetical protein